VLPKDLFKEDEANGSLAIYRSIIPQLRKKLDERKRYIFERSRYLVSGDHYNFGFTDDYCSQLINIEEEIKQPILDYLKQRYNMEWQKLKKWRDRLDTREQSMLDKKIV